jgi:hypothetical protein
VDFRENQEFVNKFNGRRTPSHGMGHRFFVGKSGPSNRRATVSLGEPDDSVMAFVLHVLIQEKRPHGPRKPA